MYDRLRRVMRIRRLAMILSKLAPHPCNVVDLEQYSTDGDLASRFIFDINSFGDINEDTVVGDLGAGNGVLGIAALKLGAKQVVFVETDIETCSVLRKNLISQRIEDSSEIINEHIDSDFSMPEVDLIICNPPWGRQKVKADRPFLNTILNNGSTAHLMHNSDATHIRPFFESKGWNVEKYGEAEFALPLTYSHHKRNRDSTKVGFWRLSPN